VAAREVWSTIHGAAYSGGEVPEDSRGRIKTAMDKRASLLLAIGLGFTACSRLSSSSGPPGGIAAAPGKVAQEALSAAGERELRETVASGKLQDLQWPNFAEHGQSVKQFYDETGYKLGWIEGSRPTPQALELVGILEGRGKKRPR
jgi:hypothetical protein